MYQHNQEARPRTGSTTGIDRWKLSLCALLALVLSFMFTLPTRAQNSEAIVYTVGNTYLVGGKTYAFLLWQPGAAATTFGT